ncbi:MAG TPA: phage repressor protein [Paenisporosarcina sp.]|nr:phage repressor protein [Paenisporosarcina sp.]
MNSWASFAIAELDAGRQVVINPKGDSMSPKIESGAEVTLVPVDDVDTLAKGDIVLVSVGRAHYLHLISAINKESVQISNNRGHVNGWTSKENVYGKVIAINNHPKVYKPCP